MDAMNVLSVFGWMFLMTVSILSAYAESSILRETSSQFNRVKDEKMAKISFGRKLLQYSEMNEDSEYSQIIPSLPPIEPIYVDPLDEHDEYSSGVTQTPPYDFTVEERQQQSLDKFEWNPKFNLNIRQPDDDTKPASLNDTSLKNQSHFIKNGTENVISIIENLHVFENGNSSTTSPDFLKKDVNESGIKIPNSTESNFVIPSLADSPGETQEPLTQSSEPLDLETSLSTFSSEETNCHKNGGCQNLTETSVNIHSTPSPDFEEKLTDVSHSITSNSMDEVIATDQTTTFNTKILDLIEHESKAARTESPQIIVDQSQESSTHKTHMEDSDYSDYASENSESLSDEPELNPNFRPSYVYEEGHSGDFQSSVESTDIPLTVEPYGSENTSTPEVDGNIIPKLEEFSTTSGHESVTQSNEFSTDVTIVTDQHDGTSIYVTSAPLPETSLMHEKSIFHNEENSNFNFTSPFLDENDAWISESDRTTSDLTPDAPDGENEVSEDVQESSDLTTHSPNVSTVSPIETMESISSKFEDSLGNFSTSSPLRVNQTDRLLENMSSHSVLNTFWSTVNLENEEETTSVGPKEIETISTSSDRTEMQTTLDDQLFQQTTTEVDYLTTISSQKDKSLSTALDYSPTELLNGSYSDFKSFDETSIDGRVTHPVTQERIEVDIVDHSIPSSTDETKSSSLNELLEHSAVSESLQSTASNTKEFQFDNNTLIFPHVDEISSPTPNEESTTNVFSLNQDQVSLSHTESPIEEINLTITETVNTHLETDYRDSTSVKVDSHTVSITETSKSITTPDSTPQEELESMESYVSEKQNGSSDVYSIVSTAQVPKINLTSYPNFTRGNYTSSTQSGGVDEKSETPAPTQTLRTNISLFQRSSIQNSTTPRNNIGSSDTPESSSKPFSSSISPLHPAILPSKFTTNAAKTFNFSLPVEKQASFQARKATSPIFLKIMSTASLPHSTTSTGPSPPSWNSCLVLFNTSIVLWLLTASFFFR